MRILLDAIAAFQFLLKGEARSFAAVIRAQVKFLFELGHDLRKRRMVRKAFPTYSDTMIYKGSVVFDYFLRGKRQGYNIPVRAKAPGSR
jgi:hypothetical protein